MGDNNYTIAELLDIDPYYLELGNKAEDRCEKYREDINKIMEEDFLGNIRKNLDGGVFGRQNFIKAMKEKFKIISLNPAGRPKKNQS